MHAAGIIIDIALVALYCTASQFLCHSESCANYVTKRIDLVSTSHSRSSLLPVSSSTSYSSPLSSYNPRRRHPDRHRTRRLFHHIIYVDGILIDIILFASYLISSTPPVSFSTSHSSGLFCNHPRCWHRHRHGIRRVLLEIMHASGILIDIALVALYCTASQCLCHSESRAKYFRKRVNLVSTSHSRSPLLPVSSPTSYSLRHTR